MSESSKFLNTKMFRKAIDIAKLYREANKGKHDFASMNKDQLPYLLNAVIQTELNGQIFEVCDYMYLTILLNESKETELGTQSGMKLCRLLFDERNSTTPDFSEYRSEAFYSPYLMATELLDQFHYSFSDEVKDTALKRLEIIKEWCLINDSEPELAEILDKKLKLYK